MPDNIAGMENPQLTIAAPEAVTGSSSSNLQCLSVKL
jgi:hypothetical protein